MHVRAGSYPSFRLILHHYLAELAVLKDTCSSEPAEFQRWEIGPVDVVATSFQSAYISACQISILSIETRYIV